MQPLCAGVGRVKIETYLSADSLHSSGPLCECEGREKEKDGEELERSLNAFFPLKRNEKEG